MTTLRAFEVAEVKETRQAIPNRSSSNAGDVRPWRDDHPSAIEALRVAGAAIEEMLKRDNADWFIHHYLTTQFDLGRRGRRPRRPPAVSRVDRGDPPPGRPGRHETVRAGEDADQGDDLFRRLRSGARSSASSRWDGGRSIIDALTWATSSPGPATSGTRFYLLPRRRRPRAGPGGGASRVLSADRDDRREVRVRRRPARRRPGHPLRQATGDFDAAQRVARRVDQGPIRHRSQRSSLQRLLRPRRDRDRCWGPAGRPEEARRTIREALVLHAADPQRASGAGQARLAMLA